MEHVRTDYCVVGADKALPCSKRATAPEGASGTVRLLMVRLFQ